MKTILFACVHNAGRSQMAAALFNAHADLRKATAISAGTQPAEHVHPVVVTAMQELGIDLSAVQPRKLTDELAKQVHLLITMGCGEACPFIPGVERADWPLADPKGLPLDQVRAIRDDLAQRLQALIQERGWQRSTRNHQNVNTRSESLTR